MALKDIAAKYERARAAAHKQFYYSMRDHWARMELDQTLEFIGWLQEQDMKKHALQASRTRAIMARRLECNRA